MTNSRNRRISFGPWLWGPRADLAIFAGSALFSLGLVFGARRLGWDDAALPEWAWLLFVLGVDVAHVYATLFRTYFDSAELRGHPYRYAIVPLAVYAIGVSLYSHAPITFWRVLAYVALFHFVRQQVGWVALYRARAGQMGFYDKLLDEATVYISTLYPVLYWHAHLGQITFVWFVPDDFWNLGGVAPLLESARWLWLVMLASFAVRQVQVFLAQRIVHAGKIVVVSTTAAVWYIGIVATNSDFSFTVSNVIVHGVPYLALLWVYAKARRAEEPGTLGSQIAGMGIGFFVTALLALACVEEFLWDRLVWHERTWLFGSAHFDVGTWATALIVPLLAVPQGTHYALDGLLWRRSETRRLQAQRMALGF